MTPYWCGFVLAALASAPVTTATLAQDSPSQSPIPAVGRIDFDFSGGAQAAVEIDLPPELIGLGELMATGVVDALMEVLHEDPSASQRMELTEERMAALRHVISSAQGLVEEVRVRVYRLDDAEVASQMVHHYTAQLEEDNWDNIATVREDNEQVRVAVRKQDESIRGVFAIVTNQREVVMVNVACELSPEKVKNLVSTALRIGMELGLDEAIREAMKELPKGIAEEMPH
jgi:hypothetical protein